MGTGCCLKLADSSLSGQSGQCMAPEGHGSAATMPAQRAMAAAGEASSARAKARTTDWVTRFGILHYHTCRLDVRL